MEDYLIIKADSIDELEDEVQKKIKEGWMAIGGVATGWYQVGDRSKSHEFYQALIKPAIFITQEQPE